MIYFLLKFPVTMALVLYFRRIYFSGLEKLPKNTPLIFACNHPTAFIDPLFVPVFLPYRHFIFHFLTRGDHFRKPIYRWMMHQINMVPIYRMKEGYTNPRRNDETFAYAYRLLRTRRHKIMIMSEGLALHAKRLKTLQKGTAWMALEAAATHDLDDLFVVPVGLSYQNPNKFRSAAMIDIGDLIPARDYLEQYALDRKKAVTEMTEDLAEQLRKHIIHVEQPEDEDLVDQILHVYIHSRKEPFFPAFSRDRSMISTCIRITEAINKMDEEDKEEVRERLEGYQLALATAGVSDLGFGRRSRFNWRNSFLLVLGALPFLLGYGLMAWPWLLGRQIANQRIKSRYLEFYASVRLGASLGITLLYGILVIVLSFWWLGWWGLLIPATMLVLGFLALYYRDLWIEWKAASAVVRLTKEQVLKLEHLQGALLSLVIG